MSDGGRLLNERKLPTWRGIILTAVLAGVGMLVLDIIFPSDRTLQALLWYPLIFFTGAIGLLPVVLVVWRLVIIMKEAITMRRQLVEYVDDDAIVVIRQNLSDTQLQQLTDEQLRDYIAAVPSSVGFDRILNEKKLLKNLASSGVHLTPGQLQELLAAEMVYLKKIGAAQ